jgi:hypothetical protein
MLAENADTLYCHSGGNTGIAWVFLIGAAIVDASGNAQQFVGTSRTSLIAHVGYGIAPSLTASVSSGYLTFTDGTIGARYFPSPMDQQQFEGVAWVLISGTWQTIGRVNGVYPYNLRSEPASKQYFIPYLLHNQFINADMFRLRQIMFGPYAVNGSEVLEAGTGNRLAQSLAGIGSHSGTATLSIWFTEFQQ